MTYKLVIFDFDGTLANSFPWVMSILDDLADKFKYERVDRDQLDVLRGYGARKLIKHYRVSVWKMLRIGKHVRKLMSNDIHEIALFEGVDRLIQRLAEKGLILALVTSNSYPNVSRVLGPQNAACFQYFECRIPLFGKPSRLKKILKKSGIPPAETIYIGDETRDHDAAHKVGISFGAVSWGYTHLEALQAHAHAPDIVFTSVDEIAEILG